MDINLRLEAHRGLPKAKDPSAPPVMTNKTHANAQLDRRVIMELHRPSERAEHINVNYILPEPRVLEILSGDLMRAEHPEKLVFKPSAGG